MSTMTEEEPKNIIIKLEDGTSDISTVQYYQTVIFKYPCTDLTSCTHYDVTLPSGMYMFETWGAQGGLNGGKGGYSRGIIHFPTKQEIHIFIGAKGDEKVHEWGEAKPSFNGGGRGFSIHIDQSKKSVGSGGGATDIRINGTTLYHRVIVSGAGGGNAEGDGVHYTAGSGGGLSGNPSALYKAQGGNQTSPGIGECEIGSSPAFHESASGDFGQGGYFSGTESTFGGGGGGWYGGASGMAGLDAGAGGSGYVLTSTSYKPENYTFSSQYFFSHTVMIDGDNKMPKCEGTFNPRNVEIGHSGNGYARITQINELPIFITCAAKRNPHLKSETYLCLYAMTLFLNNDK